MFIPCTYMCTICNFGIFLVAFLSKWRPQKSIPCTYTCTKCSLGAFLVAFLVKMASPKQHSVHVYVYIMHFLGIFGCVLHQILVSKCSFRARIRVHNALFGYFWVRFASNFGLQMFIPCTYTCTNCTFWVFLGAFFGPKSHLELT